MGEIDDDDMARAFPASQFDAHRYYQNCRQTAFVEAERNLMLAVLEDALRCLKKHQEAKNGQGRALFRDAQAWLSSRAVDGVFSFENICETLGLNATYIRKRALRAALQRSEEQSTKEIFLRSIRLRQCKRPKRLSQESKF